MILSILAKLYAGVSTSFLQEEPDFVKHAKWGFRVRCAHAGAVIPVRRSIWIWFWSHIFSEQSRPPQSDSRSTAANLQILDWISNRTSWAHSHLDKITFPLGSRKEGTNNLYRASSRWLKWSMDMFFGHLPGDPVH
jgi:hypothetical protein